MISRTAQAGLGGSRLLLVGLNFPPYVLAGVMIVFEIAFSLLLVVEVRRIN